MILLTFNRALTEGDRERIADAFAAVQDGDDKIIVVEDAALSSDSGTALVFTGIIS